MGKIDVLQVNLDKPIHVYANGETLTGTVQVRVQERIKINLIRLIFKGQVYVSW
jgi:hypothetical protein